MAETMKLSMQFFRNLTAQNLLKFSVSKSMFYTKEKNAVFSGKSQKKTLGRKRFMAWLYFLLASQPAFSCSKLTIETLQQAVKYVQS